MTLKTKNQKIGINQKPLSIQMLNNLKIGMKKTMVSGKHLQFQTLTIKANGGQRKLTTLSTRENGSILKSITLTTFLFLMSTNEEILNTSPWKSGKSKQELFSTTFLSPIMKLLPKKRETQFWKQ